jgi:hypothetical protein
LTPLHPESPRSRWWPLAIRYFLGVTVSAVLFYAALWILNFTLFHYGNSLTLLSPEIRAFFTSIGRFDIETHPLYRPWLKAFVSPPGPREDRDWVGDSDRAYGFNRRNPLALRWTIDANGFPNDRRIETADVLFVGDSFVFSGRAGFDQSISHLFEKLTGRPTYNASKSGYGFLHDYDLIDHFTAARTGPNLLRGQDVVVPLYFGADLSENIDLYLKRSQEQSHRNRQHYFSLQTIRHFIYMARTGTFAAPTETFYPRSESAEYSKTIDQLLTLNDGYFPQFVSLRPYRNEPIASDTSMHSNFVAVDPATPERLKLLDDYVGRYQELARSRELNITFVFLPPKVSVMLRYLRRPKRAQQLRFYSDAATMQAKVNVLRAHLKNSLEQHGFNVLDLTDPMIREIQRTRLFWPGDTHPTPEGNLFIAKSLVAYFKKIGASGAGAGPQSL